jgi:hypothetical protein
VLAAARLVVLAAAFRILMRRSQSQEFLGAEADERMEKFKDYSVAAADKRHARLKERLEKKFMEDFDADFPEATLQQVLGLIEELGDIQTLKQAVKRHLVLDLFKRAVQNCAERELSPYSEDRWGITLVHRACPSLY